MPQLVRIYVVRHEFSKTSRLVRASNAAQAIKHATHSDFTCSVATQDDLVRLVAEGVTVENARGDK